MRLYITTIEGPQTVALSGKTPHQDTDTSLGPQLQILTGWEVPSQFRENDSVTDGSEV
jgi:hypothetical protein